MRTYDFEDLNDEELNAARNGSVILGTFLLENNPKWTNLPDDIMSLSVHNLDKIPHVLVSGKSGCGKTVLAQRYIDAAENFPDKIKTIYIPSHVDTPEEGHHLSSTFDILDRIDDVEQEIENRKEMLEGSGVSTWSEFKKVYSTNIPLHTIVIFDDLGYIIDRFISGSVVDENDFLDKIKNLIEVGEDLGIHVVATTQNDFSVSKYIDTNIFPGKIFFDAEKTGSIGHGKAIWESEGERSAVFEIFYDEEFL